MRAVSPAERYFSVHLFAAEMEHTTTTTEDYWVGG